MENATGLQSKSFSAGDIVAFVADAFKETILDDGTVMVEAVSKPGGQSVAGSCRVKVVLNLYTCEKSTCTTTCLGPFLKDGVYYCDCDR
jgi:hypothetical protein